MDADVKDCRPKAAADNQKLLTLCIKQQAELDEVHRLIGLLTTSDEEVPLIIKTELLNALLTSLSACKKGGKAIRALSADCAQTSRLQLDVLHATADVALCPCELDDLMPAKATEPPIKTPWNWLWSTLSLSGFARTTRSSAAT